MSDFDDLVFDMDQAVSGVFGDEAVLSANGQEYPVQVVIDKGLVQSDYGAAVNKKTVSISSPPVELALGQTVRIIATGQVLTLREELDDDGYMSTWVVT